MRTKNAKKIFLFNVFLASIAAEPLEVNYAEIADLLGVSQAALSKFRHTRLSSMPASLAPDLTATRFAAEVIKKFPPNCSTVTRFAVYAQTLKNRYIVSDSLVRFITLFCTSAAAVNEERAERFYYAMIPEIMVRFYEEAYSNTEQDCQKRQLSHAGAKSELIYQKISETINEDVLDGESLKQLLNVVYAANLRNQLPNYFSNFSFLETLGEFIRSQVNQPFYTSVHRSELITITENSKHIVRAVCATEQIVAQSLNPTEFTLTQYVHDTTRLTTEEIIKRAFGKLSITVNNQPAVQYINTHENASYTSPLQFVTAKKLVRELSDIVTTELVLHFSLYPVEPGEPMNVAYEYSCTAQFTRAISCVYSYTLRYPCKFLEHEFRMDAQTRRRWGMWVKLFTPFTNGSPNVEMKQNVSMEGSSSAGFKQVVFNDWVMPGSGYSRNLYELKRTPNQSESSWY